MVIEHFEGNPLTRGLLSLVLLLGYSMHSLGCRRAAPPRFTPAPEVLELTEDLEDAEPEELELYEALQKEVTVKLTELTGTPDKLIALGDEATTDQLQHGYALYSRYCVQCHGVNGDGNGAVAEHLNPKPRNYTRGIYKFTSTPYGSKPRKSDLIRTVRVGVTGTSMPSFDRFSREQLEAVVEYVLALTYRGELERALAAYAYDDEELPDEEGLAETIAEILEPWENSADEIVMPVTMMPEMTEESVRNGHQTFLNIGCKNCHGAYGRGGMMGKVEVGKDAWGNQTAAADLSSGMFHGGDRPIDIYRRIFSGINGTPMPAFSKSFEKDPDKIWELVHFIKATGNRRRRGLAPLSASDLPTIPAVEADQPAKSDNTEESVDAEEAEETLQPAA